MAAFHALRAAVILASLALAVCALVTAVLSGGIKALAAAKAASAAVIYA